jgi:imidazolonepropionase-like amidohydrolase
MRIVKKKYHHFHLFDGISTSLQEGKVLFVEGDKIVRIEEASAAGDDPDYEAVDLNGWTLLPGLLDLHVHITVPLMSDFSNRQALFSIEQQRALNFRTCLKYGITTIRDMGAFPASIQRWKRRIDSGRAIGPRIYTANAFITSKDGPPERAPRLPLPLTWMFGGQLAERVSTPEQVRHVALTNLKQGAHFLKTQYEEESMFFQGRLVTLSDACFAALKRVAEEAGVKVAMHHTENAGFKKGLQFAFDSLEHCSLEVLEQADIEHFVAQGMAIVPTLRVNHSCFEVEEMLQWLGAEGKEDYAPEPLAQIIASLQASTRKPYPPDHQQVYLDTDKSRRGFETTRSNVERIKQAGGTIGVGTDCYGSSLNLPGFYWKELLLLTQAGLSPVEVLRAATLVNARILGVDREVGRIAPGHYADFVLIEGNPLEDITQVRNIRLVIKGGVAYVDGRPAA